MLNLKIPKFLRALLLLAAVMAIGSAAAFAQSPLPVADDVITVSGGSVSPDNPDVYIIDMGTYANSATYTINVERPKGSQANYPVSIEYILLNYEYDSGASEYCFATGTPGQVLQFAAGETSKTITFTSGSAAQLSGSMTYVYLLFGEGDRTKAEYEVVKMKFDNPSTVTATTGTNYPTITRNNDFFFFSVGHYLWMTTGEDFGHFNVLNNTRLNVKVKTVNHENIAVSASDNANASTQTVQLKPEQPVGAVSNHLEFLLKTTDDGVINDYPRESYPGTFESPGPNYVKCATALTNLEMAIDNTQYAMFNVTDNSSDLRVYDPPYQTMDVPPRFGAITTDAASYETGATVTLTIPVLNSKLLQKLHGIMGSNWLDCIDITLDGGATFLNHAYMSFDGTNITAIAEARNETGASVEVAAEIFYRTSAVSGGLGGG